MSVIASVISEIVSKKMPISDLHIVERRPMLGRWPRGYQALSKDYNISSSDIAEFLSQALVMGNDWRDKLRENQGTYEIALSLSSARVRLSIYEARGTEHSISIIGRIIPLEIPQITNLGIPATVLNIMKRSKGLFIITGPTGSGKSTTMAAMLQSVNESRPVHIMTLEDPIEYLYPVQRAVVSQREIGTNVPSFSTGLLLAMRQRPDIIAIGEVKDQDSVETMLDAAESGHLVLATMHTRNSEETISKLLSFFDKDELPQKCHSISSALIGICTQALVPSADGSKLHLASEILINNQAISQNIRENKLIQIRNTIVSGANEGMMLLNHSLSQLVKDGKVSKSDALYASYDVADLQKQVAK